MTDPADAVLAVIPVLMLLGPLVETSAPLLEVVFGVGAGLADLPLTVPGFVAAALVVIVALWWVPRRRR